MIVTDRRWKRIQKHRPRHINVTISDGGTTASCRCGQRLDLPPTWPFLWVYETLRDFFESHHGDRWQCTGRPPARRAPEHAEAHLA